MKSRVAGITFPNPDGTTRMEIASKAGVNDPVELRPEPENKFDKHAVAVYAPGGQIGYIPAFQAEAYGKLLQAGRIELVYVDEIFEGEKNGKKLMAVSICARVKGEEDADGMTLEELAQE